MVLSCPHHDDVDDQTTQALDHYEGLSSRTVRVERFVVEALEQVVTLESSERDEAAEVLDVHVLYT